MIVKIIQIICFVLLVILAVWLIKNFLEPAVYVIYVNPNEEGVERNENIKLIDLGEREITAYVPSDPTQTDDTPCYTAFGYICHLENAIACPREIPLGSEVIISGKKYVCVDRLNKKYDYRFDVAMRSREDALNWGRQKLNVYLIKYEQD